jgi:hypothetical protein
MKGREGEGGRERERELFGNCNSHFRVNLWASRYRAFCKLLHNCKLKSQRTYLKQTNYQDLCCPTLQTKAICVITYPSSKKAFSVSPVRQVATASMNVVMPKVA